MAPWHFLHAGPTGSSGSKIGLSKFGLFSFKDNPMLRCQSYQVELPTAVKSVYSLYLIDPSYQVELRPLHRFSSSVRFRPSTSQSLLLPFLSSLLSVPRLSEILAAGIISEFGFRLSLVNTWFKHNPIQTAQFIKLTYPQRFNLAAARWDS